MSKYILVLFLIVILIISNWVVLKPNTNTIIFDNYNNYYPGNKLNFTDCEIIYYINRYETDTEYEIYCYLSYTQTETITVTANFSEIKSIAFECNLLLGDVYDYFGNPDNIRHYSKNWYAHSWNNGIVAYSKDNDLLNPIWVIVIKGI